MTHSPYPRARYNVLIPTRYGMMVVNRNDWSKYDSGEAYGVGLELLQTGQYAQIELDMLAALIRLCPPEPVLLDIGANIGVHSLFMSELAGPRGKVLAFEAQRIVFQMLMGNLALNSIENVHGRHLALGSAAGVLALPALDYRQPKNFGGVSLTDAGTDAGADNVALAALDSFNLQRVDFIKIDVEGMELDVLLGASRTLDRTRPPMQVEWMGRDPQLPLHLIESLDYRVFRAGMNLLCLPAERADEVNFQGPIELTASALKQGLHLS